MAQLGIGLGLGFGKRAGSAITSLAQLFVGATDGFWYDPSDATTVFSDAAGTTPASVGGIVRRINDKSGFGHHRTAASDTASPILRSSGGLTWLEWDAVDDVMSSINTVGLVLPVWMAMCYSRTASTATSALRWFVDSTNSFLLTGNTNGRASTSIRGPAGANLLTVSSTTGIFPDGTIKVVDTLAANNLLAERVNLVAAPAAAAMVQNNGDNIGAATINNQAVGRNEYGTIGLVGNPGSNRDPATRLLAAKGGLSL